MVTPVRATPSQVVDVERPTDSTENQGSYPAEIGRDQLNWLQECAEEQRRQWAKHAQSVACNPKS